MSWEIPRLYKLGDSTIDYKSSFQIGDGERYWQAYCFAGNGGPGVTCDSGAGQ